mgnify:FL=1
MAVLSENADIPVQIIQFSWEKSQIIKWGIQIVKIRHCTQKNAGADSLDCDQG